MTVVEGTNPIQLQKVKDTNSLEPLWVNNNVLYNASGDIVGRINKENGTVKVFVMSA